MITLTIDGQEIQVKEGRTILEAARAARQLPIPTLCYHEALAPFAACRMCLVELENRRGGQLAPACAYPCEEGLIVRTNSEKVRRSRRMTIELLMASAAHVPLIRAMADDLGVDEPRFTTEPDDCILCGLCVRACDEIVGVRRHQPDQPRHREEGQPALPHRLQRLHRVRHLCSGLPHRGHHPGRHHRRTATDGLRITLGVGVRRRWTCPGLRPTYYRIRAVRRR